MDDTRCRCFFLEPVETYHRQYEALRAFFIDGRRLQDIAQQFGYQETSLRSMVCRFRAQVQAGKAPPFLGNHNWDDPSGSRKPQHQLSRRRQSLPMRARYALLRGAVCARASRGCFSSCPCWPVCASINWSAKPAILAPRWFPRPVRC